jgi:hypothetical protein
MKAKPNLKDRFVIIMVRGVKPLFVKSLGDAVKAV